MRRDQRAKRGPTARSARMRNSKDCSLRYARDPRGPHRLRALHDVRDVAMHGRHDQRAFRGNPISEFGGPRTVRARLIPTRGSTARQILCAGQWRQAGVSKGRDDSHDT